MDFVPTESIRLGEMVTFWDQFGLFLGPVGPDDISDVFVWIDQPWNSTKKEERRVGVKFTFNDRRYASDLRFFDGLQFRAGTPEEEKEFRPEHIEFLKILIDSQVRILPRIKHPYFSYDDNLRVVKHADL